MKLYNAITQSCVIYISSTRTKVVSFSEADIDVINRPIIDSTSNVTIDSGKQSAIGDDVLL